MTFYSSVFLPELCYETCCEPGQCSSLSEKEQTGGEHHVEYLVSQIYCHLFRYSSPVLTNIMQDILRGTCEGNPNQDHCRVKKCFRRKTCPGFNSECLGHFRVTCNFLLKKGGLDNNGSCGRANCIFGHDYSEGRMLLHKTRQYEAECRIALAEKNVLGVLDRGSAQASKVEAARAVSAAQTTQEAVELRCS